MLKEFYCDKCDYTCSKKSCWSQHLLTAKHAKANLGLMPANKEYACENCNKIFCHQSSYCRHKNKCQTQIISTPNEPTDKELILLLLKEHTKIAEQNSELLEVIKNGTHNTTNSHNTITNNKTFNLQFFFNETCKDAMIIMDFVDSIKLQLTDLENVGKLGYVAGISNIITSNLKALDVSQRPIHCADQKREVLYIKDENKWEKEDDEKKKIKRAINRVVSKNQRLIPKFKEAHPDCNKAASRYSDQYNKLIMEAMGGRGDNDAEKEAKIIRNITTVTTIDKDKA